MPVKTSYILILLILMVGCSQKDVRRATGQNKSSGTDSGSSDSEDFDFCKLLGIGCPKTDDGTSSQETPAPTDTSPTAVSYFMSGLSDADVKDSFYLDIGYYLSPKVNNFGENFSFECPGNSLLIGMGGNFDYMGDTEDREYRFGCAFYRTGDNQPLEKGVCERQPSSTLKEDFKAVCPDNTWFAGVDSTYNASGKARTFAFTCCSVTAPVLQKIKINQGVFYDFQRNKDGTAKVDRCSKPVNERIAAYGAVDLKKAKANDANYMVVISQNQEANAKGSQFYYDGRKSGYVNLNYTGLGPIKYFESMSVSVELLYDVALTKVEGVYHPDVKDIVFSFETCEIVVDSPTTTSTP